MSELPSRQAQRYKRPHAHRPGMESDPGQAVTLSAAVPSPRPRATRRRAPPSVALEPASAEMLFSEPDVDPLIDFLVEEAIRQWRESKHE
jgi:hypothetical protein